MGREKTKTKTYPGSIYRPSTVNTLYIKYRGRRMRTGLPDTPKGRKMAEELLVDLWREEQGLPTLRKQALDAEGSKVHSYADTLEPYNDYLAAQDITLRTRKDYVTIVQRIITKPASLCNHLGIESFVAEFIRNNPHYRPASVNIHLRSFNVYCVWLAKNGYIKKDVDLHKFRRKGEGRTVAVYTDDEIIAMLNKCSELGASRGSHYIELRWLLHFLVATGFRINEALRLEWDQILQREIIVPNKSSREPERFPISNEVREILDAIPRDRGSKVFRWSYASKSSVLRMWKDVMKECNIEPRFGFHTLRKTFQDRLFRSGIDMTDRQKLMRHSDIKVTVQSYTYTTNDRLVESLNSVASLSKSTVK